MMKSINKKNNILSFLAFAILFGCSDDTFYRTDDEGELDGNTVEAYLSLKVSDFNVQSSGTRADSPVTDDANKEHATEEENKIENIWVFQYDAAGNQLITPSYYTITEQDQLNNIKVLLKDGVPSTVCVVANTANSQWAKGEGFKTLDGLKKQAIPQPVSNNLFTEFRAIPMEGTKDNVTVASNSKVEVQVVRMFAKLKISFDRLPEGMTPKSIMVANIPYYCQVNTLGDGVIEASAASYDESVTWISKSLNTEEGVGAYAEGKVYEVYIPENLQGEKGSESDSKNEITDDNKEDRVPEKALAIEMTMDYKDPETLVSKELKYTVFPGGNTSNNFNVRRNCVYRVMMRIYSTSTNIYTPSSNCIVVIPGNTVSFEPYYRVEKGGIDGSDTDDVFKFENYLDPSDATGEKVIDKVKILWQTKDAIGDNTDGDLVKFKLNEEYPLHSEIIVKTQAEGNALIGAYNKNGEIIWSWHIWISNRNPGNVGNEVVYTTYKWDEKKIYSWTQGIKDQGEPYDRVPGVAIMPCNLGALDFEPASTNAADVVRTFGMLYQWGRKDPFPPASNPRMGDFEVNYTEKEAGIHYDNSNETIIPKTTDVQMDEVFSFHSKQVQDLTNPIEFSIQNPLVFIKGSKVNSFLQMSDYYANGDWMSNHNHKLWGGKDPTTPGLIKIQIPGINGKYIYNNYGEQKTIFDPCPTGWRVPSGDLWLGFTKNGANPSSNNDINYDVNATNSTKFGMFMYMEKSKWDKSGNVINNPGKTLFFPTQGLRLGNGQLKNPGQCGNYHNATSDESDKVNVFHVHNAYSSFHVFEYTYPHYNVKSLAGPVRCVRDRK